MEKDGYGKTFEKICLKATRDTFFPICAVIGGQGDSIFWWA